MKTTTSKSFAKLRRPRLALALVASLFVAALLTGCADDNDDFLNRNDKELSDLRKEDAAIRAELKKQIEKNREEFIAKINSLEIKLKTLIDNEGKGLDTYLSSQMEETNKLINQKFDGFDEKIAQRSHAEKEKIEDVSSKINNNVTVLKTKLSTAIADGDKEAQAKIEAQIKLNETLKTGVEQIVTEMNAMTKRIDAIETRIQFLDDLEDRFVEQDAKFADQVEDAQERITSLRELLQEDYDELTTTQLDTFNQMLEEAQPLIDELLDNLSRYEDLVSRFTNAQSELSAGLADMDLDNLMTNFNEAYSNMDALIDLTDQLAFPDIDPEDVDLDTWLDEAEALKQMLTQMSSVEIDMVFEQEASDISALVTEFQEAKDTLDDWVSTIDSWVNEFLTTLHNGADAKQENE